MLFMASLLFAAILAVGITLQAIALMEGAEIRSARSELAVVLNLRKRSTNLHLKAIFNDVEFLGRSDGIRDDLKRLTSAWKGLGESRANLLRSTYVKGVTLSDTAPAAGALMGGSMTYGLAHGNIHSRITAFAKRGSYLDIYMIDMDGNIVYSVAKQDDFATNLLSGPYDDSALAKAFATVRVAFPGASATFSDFAPYAPTAWSPAGFAVMPVFDDDTFLGAVAVMVTEEPIDQIVGFTAGLGRTGVAYFVGEDYRMRSNIGAADSPTFLKTEVRNEAVVAALTGTTDIVDATGRDGKPALIAYSPLLLRGITWALIAEIPKAEILGRIDRVRAVLLGVISALAISILASILLTPVFLFANRKLTQGDIERIRKSWNRIEKRADAFALEFFNNLFRRDPALRSMFKSDLERQSKRFAQGLGHIIDNLEKVDRMPMRLQVMGRDHHEIGVRKEHFEVFCSTLLQTLNGYRGHKLTTAERDSWADLLAAIAQEMTAWMD